MIEKVVKIILAVLLLLCLLHLPYGYYQLIRFIATGSFLFFGFSSSAKGENNFVFLYLGLAILFQPIFKIALGRELWNIVDVLVSIFLIVSLFPSFLNQKKLP
jgi:hypothetical protein